PAYQRRNFQPSTPPATMLPCTNSQTTIPPLVYLVLAPRPGIQTRPLVPLRSVVPTLKALSCSLSTARVFQQLLPSPGTQYRRSNLSMNLAFTSSDKTNFLVSFGFCQMLSATKHRRTG